MKLGIAGLPNAGKTTLFNALTGQKAETGSYANANAKPNIGQAKVPDPRLDWLAEYYHPKKYTPATMDFVDIPGVGKGQGKGNAALQAIRQVDAIVHVVRCFENDDIFLEEADARRDAETLDLELILGDIELVERRLERARKAGKSGEKKAKRECEMCEQLIAHLSEGLPARSFPFTEEDRDILQDGGLLSVKPVIYAANLDEDGMAHYGDDPNFRALSALAAEQGCAVLPVAAKFEEDISDMDGEEAAMFMEELGLTERGLDRLIRTSYDLLGYISFLTAGEDDVHAWTIVRGTKAPRAAGKVHTDIERGFIRAEIVAFEDLKACGTMQAAKEKGLFRLEGKDYVMQDGDITNFRFNI
ncbi:MAG: redox-regulated ATPase YchF [Oscillospiraceae bacterium]|nr:redox-regulated ATPase YchF [bacterium]MDY5101412.1 redox-regulated ATPase YchF [Oscillospiraceae bacterium]